MNSLSTAMLKAGIIKPDDIEEMHQKERHRVELEQRAKAKVAEDMRLKMKDAEFRRQMKARATEIVERMVAHRIDVLQYPNDSIGRALRDDFVKAHTAFIVDDLMRQMERP